MRSTGHTKKTALISGALQGIGSEFARLCARDGYDLVLVDADAARLEKFKNEIESEFKVSVRAEPRDLSRPESPREIFDELQKASIGVDMLVNNAGMATSGFFFKTDLEAERQMLELNIGALTHFIKLFLPEMLARQEGRILNVSSAVTFQPGPHMAVYYATKAYVLAFSEALAVELEGTGVSVTALCPTPEGIHSEGYVEMERERETHERTFDPKAIAALGYQGLLDGKRLIAPGSRSSFLAQIAAKARSLFSSKSSS